VFFVSGGASYATTDPISELRFGGLDYSSSITPTFGLGVDFPSLRQFNALVIRFELLYSSWNFEGTGSGKSVTDADLDWRYELEVRNITPSLSLLFSPFRGPSYRIYGGIGVGYNFSSYPKNTFTEVNHYENRTKTTENFLEYEKSWLGANVHIGGVWKNYEVIFSGRLFGAFERFSAIELTVNTYSMRLAYRF
jgi:hypothetical protein